MSWGLITEGDGDSDDERVISLFTEQSVYNQTKSDYLSAGILMPPDGQMGDWSEISLKIFLWMSISFLVVYLCAALVSLFTLRKHPYFCFFSLSLVVMSILGVFIFGAPTSMVLGFAISASRNRISTWHCVAAGVLQTFFIVLVSVTRLLATL